ncbi:LysE family translocator [Desulfotomaculum sp. 1211_IL3151]|uniref:LysE family translocator n=1 Tax=Desulfotomaculum sp. 1211_IL3151 TaxID=3084055 RepID=UPI002FDB6304
MCEEDTPSAGVSHILRIRRQPSGNWYYHFPEKEYIITGITDERGFKMEFSLKEILSFLSITLLLVMFPGPNTVLVIHSVGVFGKKSGFFNVAGIVSALYFHALLAAMGLSVIVTQSAQLYMNIKYLGAFYIFYLGLTSLYSSCFQRDNAVNNYQQTIKNTDTVVVENHRFSFYQGLMTNILNPKVVLFYLSFLPQFVHNQNNFLMESLFLTFLYSLVSVTWYSLLVLSVYRFSNFLDHKSTKRTIKAISGVLLLGLSIEMAIEN